jgi:hypothetical protein
MCTLVETGIDISTHECDCIISAVGNSNCMWLLNPCVWLQNKHDCYTISYKYSMLYLNYSHHSVNFSDVPINDANTWCAQLNCFLLKPCLVHILLNYPSLTAYHLTKSLHLVWQGRGILTRVHRGQGAVIKAPEQFGLPLVWTVVIVEKLFWQHQLTWTSMWIIS